MTQKGLYPNINCKKMKWGGEEKANKHHIDIICIIQHLSSGKIRLVGNLTLN